MAGQARGGDRDPEARIAPPPSGPHASPTPARSPRRTVPSPEHPVPWSAVQDVRTFHPRGVLVEAVLVTASGECLLHDELTDFAALVRALVHHGVMRDGMYTGRYAGMDPR